MEHQESFLYEAISVFHESGVQYGKPLWDFECQLNTEDADTLNYSKSHNAFKYWAASQKFPVLSNVLIPDGIYPVNLFKVHQDYNKQFGVDISHYGYTGNNLSKETERFPSVSTDCPFDEVLPAPKSDMTIDLEFLLNSKGIQLDQLIRDNISESGDINHDSLAQLPKFMYN